MRKTATARTASGESGVAGVSTAALLRDLGFQEGTVTNRNNTQLRNTVFALEDDKTRAYSNMVNRFNNMSYIAQPSFLGTAMEVGQNYATEANIAKADAYFAGD